MNILKNKKNVFSANTSEINILVYTESFLKENEAIEFLKKADELTGINIYFMPLISDEIELSFETGKYSYCKEGVITSVIMNFKDCGSVVSMHRGVPNDIEDIEIYRLAENSIINGQLVSDLFDYVVVKEKLVNKDSCNIPVIRLEECRDILRLFLVQRKQFQISEHTSTDETGYYIYKHKQLFSEFQNYWSAVCKSKALDDWADALDNRLELMTICFDQCKIEAYKSQNNTTVMYLKYHLLHLLSLITGTFDNLAWIINNQYDLKLHRMKIDLRGKDFKEAVENRSPEIHEILTDEEIVAIIDAIRELRDRIVHRDFIKAIHGGKAHSSYETSYFYVDKIAFDLLRNAGLPDETVECLTSKAAFIDMIAFINFLESCTVSLVNRLLKVIAREIYNANDTYEIWKLLGFAVEPYVL